MARGGTQNQDFQVRNVVLVADRRYLCNRHHDDLDRAEEQEEVLLLSATK